MSRQLFECVWPFFGVKNKSRDWFPSYYLDQTYKIMKNGKRKWIVPKCSEQISQSLPVFRAIQYTVFGYLDVRYYLARYGLWKIFKKIIHCSLAPGYCSLAPGYCSLASGYCVIYVPEFSLVLFTIIWFFIKSFLLRMGKVWDQQCTCCYF